MIASATRSASARSTRSNVVSRRTPSIRSMGRDPTFKWMSDARCSTACRRSWSRSSMGVSGGRLSPTYRHPRFPAEAKARPRPADRSGEADRYPGLMAVRTRWTDGRALTGRARAAREHQGWARAAREHAGWALVRPRDAKWAAVHLQVLDPGSVTPDGVRALCTNLAHQ